MDEKSEPEDQNLTGGALLSAISNRFVGLLREHYGRGPTRAKTYILDDLVVCVLRNGFTALEQTMVDSGQAGDVVEMRHRFQSLMASKYKDAIEELTGVKVVAFLSQAHVEPDITLEIFLVDRSLEGAGVEIFEDPAAADTGIADGPA